MELKQFSSVLVEVKGRFSRVWPQPLLPSAAAWGSCNNRQPSLRHVNRPWNKKLKAKLAKSR